MSYGKTDDFSYNVVDEPVAVRDLHATLLHQLGVDHEAAQASRFQGLDQRLTGVEPAKSSMTFSLNVCRTVLGGAESR